MKLTKLLHVVCTQKFWSDLFILTFGIIIVAVGVYYFQVPSNLVVGSVPGLAMVLTEFLQVSFGVSLSISTLILMMNVVLLIFAYAFIGKEFGIKTVYASMILGPFVGLFEKYLPYQQFLEEGATSLMNDPWLDLLSYVILISISQAILFKNNASTGGLDIVGKIINKYMHYEIGTSVAIAGFLICCLGFYFNPFSLVMLGLIGTWINGVVIDYFSAGLSRKKRVHIVAKDPCEFQDYILHTLRRGCSLYEVTGGFSKEKKVMIEALLTVEEFANLMEYVNEKQLNAFITSDSVTEVYGLWADKKTQKALRNGNTEALQKLEEKFHHKS